MDNKGICGNRTVLFSTGYDSFAIGIFMVFLDDPQVPYSKSVKLVLPSLRWSVGHPTAFFWETESHGLRVVDYLHPYFRNHMDAKRCT